MVRRSIGASNVTSKTQGELERVDPQKWARVELLNSLIRPTLEHPFDKNQAEQIAQLLKVHWTTVFRYRRRLLIADTATAVVGRKRGFPAGSTRLTPDQEAVIDKVIARLLRGATKLRVIDVF